jgi:hypothetical protein
LGKFPRAWRDTCPRPGSEVARGRGTRGRRCRERADTRRGSLRTNRGFTWITWDRVAPPGVSRTPEPRRRDPLVQPQLLSNSWLYAARKIRRFVGARGIRGLDAEGRCGRANDGPGRARSGVCHRSSTRVALCGPHGALSGPKNLQTSQLRVHPGEISSARPNARIWTALVTETHTDFGK